MLTKATMPRAGLGKTDGLMPVVVQHAVSGEVLMLGYMNPEALDKTLESGKVTFFADQAAPVDQRRNIRSLPEW